MDDIGSDFTGTGLSSAVLLLFVQFAHVVCWRSLLFSCSSFLLSDCRFATISSNSSMYAFLRSRAACAATLFFSFLQDSNYHHDHQQHLKRTDTKNDIQNHCQCLTTLQKRSWCIDKKLMFTFFVAFHRVRDVWGVAFFWAWWRCHHCTRTPSTRSRFLLHYSWFRFCRFGKCWGVRVIV